MFKMGNERKFKKPWSLAEFLEVFLFHHAVLVYVFFYHMLVYGWLMIETMVEEASFRLAGLMLSIY